MNRVLLCFLILISCACGYSAEYNKRIKPNTKMSLSPIIGLSPGSTISISINSVEGENPLLLMIYDSNQRPDEFAYSDSVSDGLCIQPSAYRNQIDSMFSYVYTVNYESQYSVIVLNCFSTPAVLSGSIQVKTFYNGMMVNLTIEKQFETIIWPAVSLLYLGLFITFLVMNSKAQYRGTTHVRNIDYVLELLVAVKFMSSVLRSVVVWYLLLNNSISPFAEFMNSFMYSFVDDLLLVVMFLLACGWQISHLLLTKKEIQFGVCIFCAMCILSSISSYCDSQIDGLCSGFAVVDYIFEAIFIITILICINISISASSSILQSSQYNSATIRIYINKASFIALMWTFIIYILRPTFVAIIGRTVLSWKYQDLVVVVNEAILFYVIIRLRILVHPYSYKGYYRVNREIISHMNQEIQEDEGLPLEQTNIGRNRSFSRLPRDGVYNRAEGPNWFE